MDIDDQRAPAGEFRGIGAVEEAADQFAVKALHFDEFGLDIDRGVKPAGFAEGPAGHCQRGGINRISVGRNLGARYGQANRAPRRDVDPADGALGQAGDFADCAGFGIEQLKLVYPGFVDRIGDEAAIIGNIKTFDIPFGFRTPGGELAGLGIERAEPLKIAPFVAGHPQAAIGGKAPAAIGDLLLVVANRGHGATGQIKPEQVGLGHRDIVGDDRKLVVWSEPGNAPAAALQFLDHSVGLGIARIHHIQIGIGAVAAG